MLSRRQFMFAALGAAALPALPRSFAVAQTPTSGDSVDPELLRYLSLSPTSIANLGQPMPLLAGNQRLQADAMSIPLPFDMADDEQMHLWIQGMFNVALPSFMLQNVLRDDFTALTGFDITQIDSGAEIGEPPGMVTFLRGTFDVAQVQATQLGLGYQPVDVAGHPAVSLFADAELDLTNPVQSMALARMNNSTVLDDGTLVYAPTLELIEAVLTPNSTLAEVPEVQRALSTLDSPLITSTVLGPGNFMPSFPVEMFLPSDPDEIAASLRARMETAPVPIVLAGIAGSTAGGPIDLDGDPDTVDLLPGPTSVSKFALAYLTPEDAATAAPQIEERLATGSSVMNNQPWTELFSTWSAVPNSDQATVLVTLEWANRAARTLNLIFSRDLGFITG